MDLKRPMELAGQALLNCLVPSLGYLPFWSFAVDSEQRAVIRADGPWHNIGRWWDAMLRLENATGFIIPGHLEGAMLQNTYRFFDNPDNLCFAPFDMEGVSPTFDLHHLRESLLALNALVRFRDSSWAVEQGHRMLESLLRCSRPDCSWDLDKLDYYVRLGCPADAAQDTQPNVSTDGRLIEALVWFYEATGDPLALELADRFAAYHLEKTTNRDGTINCASSPTHTHSYLGTLRGLLLFGLLTNQHEYVDRIAATYRVTVRKLVKESGWASHDLEQDRRPETTSPGDAAQLALWLALHAGHTELLDDVERIVRARLVPSQITESPEVLPPDGDSEIELDNLEGRFVGGLGGMHTEPHAGKKNTTDITAAVLHSLIDIYNNIVVSMREGLAVYFHLDYEEEHLKVSAQRGEIEAKLAVLTAVADNVLIRIPQWTAPESVRVTVNGSNVTPILLGNFAHVPAHKLPGEIVVRYELPVRKTKETSQGTEFTFDWSGDEIKGVCPNSDFFPFYQTGEGCR